MSKRKKSLKAIEANQIAKIDKIISWLIILFIGITPLLVRFRKIPFVSPRIITPMVDTGTQVDAFFYYKWVFLLCMTVVLVSLLCYKILAYHYEIKASYINIPLLIFISLLILSLTVADYKSVSLVGLYNRYDGTLTYLCYMAILFVAANVNYRLGMDRYIAFALGAVITINFILIIPDFFGHNLLGYPYVVSLLVPTDLQQNLQGTINSTLSNSNYISGLAAALCAYFLGFALLKNRLKQKCIYTLFAVFAFAIMLVALSSSGIVSLVVVLPLIIAIAYIISRDRKRTFITAGTVLLLFSLVFMLLNAHNPKIYSETIGFFQHPLTPGQGTINSEAVKLDGVYLPASGRTAGSSRGYIWSETLDLIKQKPLTGYGQDTLAYYFPQNDIKKVAGIGSYNLLITKPHNAYLGIAYGSGIPASLALLALLFIHFYHTGRFLLRADKNEAIILPASLFFFFSVFAIQLVFNDSNIGSSSIFWPLLGIAVSLQNNSLMSE